MTRVLVLALLAACGGAPRALPSGSAAASDEITLYRDRAVIKQRIAVVVPVAGHATVSITLPAGVAVDDVAVVDRGVLTVSEVRGPTEPIEEPAAPSRDGVFDPDTGEDIDLEEDLAKMEPPETPTPTPTKVTFDVSAPKAGRYTLAVAYPTDRLTWDAAYTMTTTPARTRVTLRGAIAIRNRLETPLPEAHVYVVDAEIGAWKGRVAEQLGGADASTTPLAISRIVGDLALGTGETRVELLPADPPRTMRSVLVYDPIGTKLDNGGARPILDASLGMERATPRVTESFEIARTHASSDGLPGGPVRLLERRTDGTLAVLGESRLFDAATRVATVDTIALGTAEGVTGARERRELSYDEDNRRLVEEFVLTITNTRAYPVEVVLREHLYRGQNWTLAYQTASEPTKEGPQQISLRTIAPPRGEAKVLYVVVYTGL